MSMFSAMHDALTDFGMAEIPRISDYGYDSTLHAFDRSLRKLGLDYLDLYLLH